MKFHLLLLHLFVDLLVSGYFSGASDRVTRPRNRPTALRAGTEQVQQNDPHLFSKMRYANTLVQADQLHVVKQDYLLANGRAAPTRKMPRVNIADEPTDKKAKSAAELTGVKANHHGHFSTAFITCLINMSVVCTCALMFSALRLRYPLMYSGNVVVSKIAPLAPDDTFCGWCKASCGVSTEMAADSVGLDAALLIEFCNMACKILAILGIPMVCIMCPLHYFFGGHDAPLDELSSVQMSNVVVGHAWLYYVHAVIVNLVTFFVIRVVYAAMPNFLMLRYNWLKHMPAPRCVTVLVEEIPQGWRTEAKLREFFSTMFKAECVKDCVVVKDAPDLLKMFNEQTHYSELLKDYKERWQASDCTQEERPTMRETMCFGKKVDAIDFIEQKLAELGPQVREARLAALKDAEEEGGINCASGFVTFTRRREAEVCHNVIAFSSHRDEWVVSVPPPASDVRWSDLKNSASKNSVLTVIGYFCTLTLFVLFIPLVVLGTSLSSTVHVGFLQPLWNSFAPGLALMLFLAFLPTVLLLIFSSCFSLKSELFAQHKLQIWYFLFMVFFVILVTVIGQSLLETLDRVVHRPGLAFELLATNMPGATQFYMDFLMLQWGEQSINFLRAAPVAKFILFNTFFEEADAKRMAEPEDQDFYGIGSRSARFTISLLIGIIFCTLSPPIAILGLVLFGLMRVYYGYLLVFAEEKKPDLGGVFFNTQLQHLILGVGVYNVLMIGVLCFRASNSLPMLLAVPSIVYTGFSYWHFTHNFVWRELPFSEVCAHPDELTAEDNGFRYTQPEFAESSDDKPGLLNRFKATFRFADKSRRASFGHGFGPSFAETAEATHKSTLLAPGQAEA